MRFAGRGDTTKCFHYGGGLQDWRRTDDPWTEHALWFPYCVYVRYIKGKHSSANIEACKREDGYVHLCDRLPLQDT